MGRLRGRNREALRLKVVELAHQNVKPKDIAKRFGISPAVARKLIQESPEIPPMRERIAALVAQGMKDSEVAAAVGRSKRRILEVKQELRGRPLIPRPTPEQNVERFLKSPETEHSMPYTKTRPFANALVAKCLACADNNPHEGILVTGPAISLFESHVRNRRKTAASLALCNLHQVRGIKATSLILIEEAEAAWKIIEEGLTKGPCEGCYIDYHNRAGLILTAWGRCLEKSNNELAREKFSQAEEFLDIAEIGYRRQPEVDHDLHGNGLAHVYFNRAYLRFCSAGGESAAAVAREGLVLTDPCRSVTLHGLLLHVLATGLMIAESPEGRPEARRIIDERLEAFGDTVSVPAMRTRWVSGLLHATCGDLDFAIVHLEDALSDAVKLSLQAEVAAIAADLFFVDPDPATISAGIAGLCTGLSDTEDPPGESLRAALPRWMARGVREQLAALYCAAQVCSAPDNLKELAHVLRNAAASISARTLMPAISL